MRVYQFRHFRLGEGEVIPGRPAGVKCGPSRLEYP
jgi:hypothetical protein